MKRFKEVKDGYLDTKTGLVWQAEDTGVMTWDAAMSYAEKLDGWRLPTIEELITIIDFSKYDPATELPGMSTGSYWGSSSSASNADNAWNVYFNGGHVSSYHKGSSRYVRCVRGSGFEVKDET